MRKAWKSNYGEEYEETVIGLYGDLKSPTQKLTYLKAFSGFFIRESDKASRDDYNPAPEDTPEAMPEAPKSLEIDLSDTSDDKDETK